MPVDDLVWAVADFKEHQKVAQTLSDYYEGDHPLLFATEKFRNTFGVLFQTLADNLCPAVVDAVAERIAVTGWDGDDAVKVEKLAEKLKFNRSARQIFKDATKLGDSYLIVWKDKKDQVCLWPHDAQQVTVRYAEDDDPSLVELGAKVWLDTDEFARMTLYYDDHFERYRSKKKMTETHGLGDRVEDWESFSSDIINDYGVVPVFHFGNDANVGQRGVSELKDVIPLQNTLNKALCDMLVAMEFVAYPQRWATGLQVEIDEDTGKPKNPPFTPGVDRIWTAAGEVKFGQFGAAELKQFLEVQDSIRAEIARVSGTPTHFLNLERTWPSGEALKVSEGRLIKKVIDRTTIYDDPTIGAMSLALDLNGQGSDSLDIKPIWANPSPHNPLLDAETQLVKQQLGLSKQRSLSELGYSDEDIAQMMEEVATEQQRQLDMQMQSVAPPGGPNAFNRNGSPGQASKPAPQQQQKAVVPTPLPRAGRGQYGEG